MSYRDAFGLIMPDDTTKHWVVSVSKETDDAVRALLAERGMTEGDLSKFVEDAVRWRVFDQTLAEVREKFADLSPEEIDALVDEAVRETRKEHSNAGR